MVVAAGDSALLQVFRGCNVRVAGTPEAPLFCAADIATHIGETNPHRATQKMPKEYIRGVKTLDTLDRARTIRYLTEAGMCKYLLQSKRPLAQQFHTQLISLIVQARAPNATPVVATVEAAEIEVAMPALGEEDDDGAPGDGVLGDEELAIPPGS